MPFADSAAVVSDAWLPAVLRQRPHASWQLQCRGSRGVQKLGILCDACADTAAVASVTCLHSLRATMPGK
jgi:hypothetical protein